MAPVVAAVVRSLAVVQIHGVHIDAPILPNQALGGIELRTSLLDIQDMLLAQYVRLVSVLDHTWYGMYHLFEARYHIGPVSIAVDVRNGKIFKLIAHEGYQGKLFGTIAVGMRVQDALDLEPRLYFDEAEGLILCQGVDGVVIDVDEDDPDPAMVPSKFIHAISVEATEVWTRPGFEGSW
jgi:hypothetical protein